MNRPVGFKKTKIGKKNEIKKMKSNKKNEIK